MKTLKKMFFIDKISNVDSEYIEGFILGALIALMISWIFLGVLYPVYVLIGGKSLVVADVIIGWICFFLFSVIRYFQVVKK